MTYTVTQEDRDAAASGYYAWVSSNPVIPAKMRAGEWDDHSMVQAFARHRTEATKELVEALQAIAGFSEVNGMTRVRMRQIARTAISRATGGEA